MTDQHPITPPPELVEEWFEAAPDYGEWKQCFATQAARWGANQELEACINWLDRNNQWARVDLDELRDGRRPNPLSLKEQALAALSRVKSGALCLDTIADADTIRRALEALPDD